MRGSHFWLKDTEDGSKNIFGRYSSQRMKVSYVGGQDGFDKLNQLVCIVNVGVDLGDQLHIN